MTASHPDTRVPVTGVVGLGSVGEGLLRLLAARGHRVVAVDTDPDVLARVERRLKALLADVEQQPDVVLTTDHARLDTADVVVEAVPDTAGAKEDALRRIAAVRPPGTPLVTTTASLSVAGLAVGTGRPADVAGIRLFGPPEPGAPAEPVVTAFTSPETAAALTALVKASGLAPVEVGAGPAADATALLLGLLNRSVAMLSEGHVTHTDIDTAMRLGCGLPAGPLETLDRWGLDTAHAALTRLHRLTGDRGFAPAPLLGRMVAAGDVGRKAGRGFYTWDESGVQVTDATDATDRSEHGPAGPVRPVGRVGVVGSGAMARGIAEVTAAAGHPTVLVARGPEKARAAVEAVAGSLTRGVRRGRITPATRAETLERLSGAHDVAALADCDLVIEAVAEEPGVKRAVFARLGEVCAEGTVLATTTSSLSVAACAEASGRPADTVGLHFFNPAPLMRLVELVVTEEADPAVVARARAFTRDLGKTPVECPDRTGFIVNTLLFPYLGAALALLERAGDDDVVARTDAAVQRGFGFPMGPFALLDTIGLDVSLAIQRRLAECFATEEFEPSGVLAGLVDAGFLGRKNGRGLCTTGG
ncbi:3-hydroxyacyl-CoA dehydrogenase family protein [Streptomyces sp. NPDC002640]